MNFIYSILRRYFLVVKTDRHTFKLIFAVVLILVVYIPLKYISFLEKNLNVEFGTLPVYVGFPIFAFLPLIALVYAYYPGYKYLDSVQKYSFFKVTVFFWIIILTPFSGMYLLSEYF
jgi:hypothetical protein